MIGEMENVDFIGALCAMGMGLLLVMGAVTLANVLDFVSAVLTSRRLGVKLRSAKIRHGLDKIMRYMMLVAAFFSADMVVALSGLSGVPWCAMAAGLVVVGVEVMSMLEHTVRRRDKIGKVPEMVRDVAEWLGEERAARLAGELMNVVERKLKEANEDEKD